MTTTYTLPSGDNIVLHANGPKVIPSTWDKTQAHDRGDGTYWVFQAGEWRVATEDELKSCCCGCLDTYSATFPDRGTFACSLTWQDGDLRGYSYSDEFIFVLIWNYVWTQSNPPDGPWDTPVLATWKAGYEDNVEPWANTLYEKTEATKCPDGTYDSGVEVAVP
jgi:hypothetical protein